ncbi:MAG: hypothetical protein K2Q06_10970, partial [Parvularculaceae bacterium]|nr:hypothetical protein [Parvularculaceae bacterium]
MRLAAVIGALACLAAPAVAAEPDNAPQIAIVETAPSQFRLEYRLSRPARALYFVREANDLRARRWRSSEPVAFETDGRQTRVVRKDGAAFSTLAFEIDGRRYDDMAEDYALVTPFSDGDALVYTGYFHACADAPCDAEAAWTVRAEPARRRRVSVGALDAKGPLDFRDGGDGAFVFVGAKHPSHVGGARAVFDAAVPTSVRRAIQTSTPALLDWFDDAIGRAAARPTFDVSVAPAPAAP